MSTRLIAAAIAACATLAATPALADHRHGFYRQPPGAVVVERTVVYRNAPRVVYAEPAYYPEPVYYPAPVYYAPPPVYYAPGPVYYGQRHYHGHDDDAWKWVAGGAIAGAILYGIDH